MQHRWGIAMMTGGWGHCIQMPLKGRLDHGGKRDPCLIWGREMVPFLKRLDVESGGEKELDGVGDELPIRILIAAKEGCFSVFLNSVEKDLRGIGGQVGAAENRIAHFKDGRRRLAIDGAQLVQDVNDVHAGVPTLDRGVI